MPTFTGNHTHALRNVVVDYVGEFDAQAPQIAWRAAVAVDGRPLASLGGRVACDDTLDTPIACVLKALHRRIDAIDEGLPARRAHP